MRKLSAALAAAALLTVAPAALAETKVAAIDLNRAIGDTNEGSRATLALRDLHDKRQAEIDTRQSALLKEKAELEKKCRGKEGHADCDQKVADYNKRAGDLEQTREKFSQEWAQKQAEATKPILERMHRVVERLAKQKGYDLVVDRTAAPYVRGDLDLTELAVKTYNDDTPTISPLSKEERARIDRPPGATGADAKKDDKGAKPPPKKK